MCIFIFLHYLSNKSRNTATKQPLKDTEADKEYAFLEAPSHNYFCPVTYGLLLEPYQTDCCGKHLSKDAIAKLTMSAQCPMCQQEGFSATHDKHFQREVKELLVFCPHRNRGCGFMADIADMERHVPRCSKKDHQILTYKELGIIILMLHLYSYFVINIHRD